MKDKNRLTVYYYTSATGVKVGLSVNDTSQLLIRCRHFITRCFSGNAVFSLATYFLRKMYEVMMWCVVL